MRKWAVGYVVAAVPLAIASFALPEHHLILWGLLGWSATAAVVVGVVKNRPDRPLPWMLVAGALATFVTGDMTYDILTKVLGHPNPFPSVADAFYLATYPLFAGGLLALVRARSPERKLGPLLDALIVTTSCGVFLMEPYVQAADLPLLEKIVSIYYPLADIAILCVLATLVLAVGLRNWSVRLLDRERALLRDVADRKVLEVELRHQAFHDSLTKLPNRALFHDRVDHALSRRARLGTDVSVLLLDMDDFKAVNDTLGHPAGDDVLVQFAERLVGCLRGEDTAARLGGDEFAVCL